MRQKVLQTGAGYGTTAMAIAGLAYGLGGLALGIMEPKEALPYVWEALCFLFLRRALGQLSK